MDFSSPTVTLFLLALINSTVLTCRCHFMYPVDSIIQFGDSFSDTGNSVQDSFEGQAAQAAHLPYGETSGKPTGRYSDGLLIIDFFAKAVNLPLINPYWNKSASFQNGVNFAVAGATALDVAFLKARGITLPTAVALSNQTAWFRHYLASICSSPTECSNKLRKSLVILGEIGANDLNFGFLQGKVSLQELRAFVPLIVHTILNTATEIIRLGASRIIVPGNFPNGCFPDVLYAFSNMNASAGEYDEYGCSRSYNNLTMHLNTQLQAALSSLSLEFPNVTVIYADFYGAFLSVLDHAPLLGFEKGSVLKACCGIGGQYNYNGSNRCGISGVPVCSNPRRYIHWDGIHLTEEAYFRISQVLFPQALTKVNIF